MEQHSRDMEQHKLDMEQHSRNILGSQGMPAAEFLLLRIAGNVGVMTGERQEVSNEKSSNGAFLASGSTQTQHEQRKLDSKRLSAMIGKSKGGDVGKRFD
jgi:hypothetical protein